MRQPPLKCSFLLMLLMAAAASIVAVAEGAASAASTAPAAAANASATPAAAANASATPAAAANASATPAAAANASAAPTTPEGFPERQCFFPFLMNGKWQHTCKKYNDEGEYWCSLTENFSRDEDWRRCHSHDLKRFQCRIPFKFNGTLHRQCLPLEAGAGAELGAHHGFWCAVVPEIRRWSWNSGDWAYCERPDATGLEYLKAAGSQKFPPANFTSSPSSSSGSGAEKAASLAEGHDNSGASGSEAMGSAPTVGVAVGAVCAVLAVVAVISAFVVRRRRRHRGSALLPRSGSDSGTYGGVEASGP